MGVGNSNTGGGGGKASSNNMSEGCGEGTNFKRVTNLSGGGTMAVSVKQETTVDNNLVAASGFVDSTTFVNSPSVGGQRQNRQMPATRVEACEQSTLPSKCTDCKHHFSFFLSFFRFLFLFILFVRFVCSVVLLAIARSHFVTLVLFFSSTSFLRKLVIFIFTKLNIS